MGWHPCWNHTCCENVRGQCYGGGCRLNPAPEVDDRDEREDEDETDDETEDEK